MCRFFVLCTLTAALVGTFTSASADITMEEKLSVEGSGLMSFANMTGHSTNTISGSRARMESDIEMQSKLVRVFAHSASGPKADIVRLDDDKIFHLDLKKKEYTETSFAEMRAQLQSAQEQQQKAQESQQRSATGVDESQCEWSDPRADVKRTGEKATIAGFDSERRIITASQSCKDKKTGAVCDFALTVDQWIAPKFANASETQAYYKAYAEKMGFAASGSKDFAERAQQLFGRYKGIWQEIAAKTADTKGYPVKSSIGFGIGGPQCQSTQKSEGSDSSESSAGPGGLAGQLGGALGGLFGKKKKDEDAAPAPAVKLPNAMVPLMTMTTELLSVSNASAAPDRFEVPAGFKKVAK